MEFMKEALSDVQHGYYVKKDPLGEEGDFITSPELNQMFGELIAIWFLNHYANSAKPKEIQFVELGPGKGTLTEDVLRTCQRLKHVIKDVDISVHLVEISRALSSVQYNRLCSEACDFDANDKIQGTYMTGSTDTGVNVHWHSHIDYVPKDKLTYYIAHEFFDALPIHKFALTEKGWRELFVDVAEGDKPALRYVLSRNHTPASKAFMLAKDENRKLVEVCPQAGIISLQIAKHVAECDGAALIIDYGHFGTKEDTLRAYKAHKQTDVLENVGEGDITADVDFKFIQDTIENANCNVSIHGPTTQHDFLKNMGIDVRLMNLLRQCRNSEDHRKIVASYKMIVGKENMGERFKFLGITSKNSSAVVPGFPSTS